MNLLYFAMGLHPHRLPASLLFLLAGPHPRSLALGGFAPRAGRRRFARGRCLAALCHVIYGLLFIASPAFAQRLPQDVRPTHYDITVAPDLAAAKFTGSVGIRVRMMKPLRKIVLNAAEIDFERVTVRAAGKTQKGTVTLDPKNDQATITVPAIVPRGEANIRIDYRGTLNDDLRGLYLSKANNRRYAVTQLEATDARRMFPSFDEPAFKATFSLTAVIDEADRAISNGEIVSTTAGPGAGKKTITFETTPTMSTYLVALAVGDFECNEGAADGIPVRVCSTPDKKKLTLFAVEATKQILQYYNRYYSIRYPFKKLDIVAVPDFAAGAMENTGAIFYRETYLLADEKASVGTRKLIAGVLAHEIAHQWFGDLVTMRWWDDLWLNEGFANWMQTKPVKAWKPEWHAELAEVSDNQTAMGLDALSSTRPIRARAETPAEINELFDPIAYEKGAAIVRMIESWVGEEAFQKGVNAYIERFKYGNASAEDFWTAIATATGKPVDKVMPTFVDRPGVPVVGVAVSCAGEAGTVALTQERYELAAGAKTAATNHQQAASNHEPRTTNDGVWQIPVCLRGPDGKTTCELADEKAERVPLSSCPSWVMANAGARGYYRAALPPEMIRKLAPDVMKLAPAERISLVADEWALVRAGRHDIGTYLDLVSGLKGERNPTVMQTVVGTLRIIGEDFPTDRTREPFRKWVSELLSPALREVGFTPRPDEDDDARELRAAVVGALGYTARDPGVLSQARSVVEQELAKPGSGDATLLNVVVNLAALNADTALYEKYLARTRAATNPEDRYLFLYGLTAFGDRALVRRTMDLIVGPEVRSQDAKLVLRYLLANPDARDLAWDLTRERWADIQKKTGEFVGNSLIVGGLASFCDPASADEMQSFFAVHKVPDAERTLQQSLERIRACGALTEGQRDKLGAWLQAR